jgi:tetratricopeptide (TPR) repeat protein
MAAGQFSKAEALISRWLKARPNSAKAQFLKGRVELARGNVRSAAEALKRAGALGYPQPQLGVLQALIDAKLGRYAEAEPVLRLAFEKAKGPDPQLDEALARVYLETFDLVRAALVLDRFAREAPDDPRPHLWRAEIDSRTESAPDAVLNDYREALKRDPDLARARLGLADELRKAHRNAEAATENNRRSCSATSAASASVWPPWTSAPTLTPSTSAAVRPSVTSTTMATLISSSTIRIGPLHCCATIRSRPTTGSGSNYTERGAIATPSGPGSKSSRQAG